MKKILFILGFVSLLVAGCSDFFDTAPSNKIPTTMRKVGYAIHAICSIIVLIV